MLLDTNGIIGRIRPYADAIAAVMGAGPKVDALRIHPIKMARDRAVLRLDCGGRLAALKLFEVDGDGRLPFERERDILSALKGWSGTARHLAHCDRDGFILTDWVEGASPAGCFGLRDAGILARSLGEWLGHFDAFSPMRPVFATWGDYVGQLRHGAGIDRLKSVAKELDSIPVRCMTLARCDASLENYLITKDGRCVGIDFEKTRFKPRGWDFVLTFLVLTEARPGDPRNTLAQLAEGFVQAGMPPLLVEELTTVANLVFHALAIGRTPKYETATHGH